MAADGAVSDFATGLTMLTDLRTGPDGALYAAVRHVHGAGSGARQCAVLRIKEGDTSEIVVPGLMFPTSIDFSTDGGTFVTVSGVKARSGQGEVRRPAAMEGMPVAEAMAAMAPYCLPASRRPSDETAADRGGHGRSCADRRSDGRAADRGGHGPPPTEEAMAEAAPTEEAMAEAAPARQARKDAGHRRRWRSRPGLSSCCCWWQRWLVLYSSGAARPRNTG